MPPEYRTRGLAMNNHTKAACLSAIRLGLISALLGALYLAGVRIPLLTDVLFPGAMFVAGWRADVFAGEEHFRAWAVPIAVVANTVGGLLAGAAVSYVVSAARGHQRRRPPAPAQPAAKRTGGTLADRNGEKTPASTGGVTVCLGEIISEMIDVAEEETAYLNRLTGELITLTEPERDALEKGHAPAEPPAPQRDIAKLHKLAADGDLLELPTKYDAHEYSLVERFCEGVKDSGHRAKLLEAIRGPRAFRDFQETVGRLGLQEQWFCFRDEAFERIAVGWLEENRIAFDRNRS